MTVLYSSNFGHTQSFSDTNAQVSLLVGAEQTFTIPGLATQSFIVEFSYIETSNVWVRKNGTATVPAAGTTGTQQYGDFRPRKRLVNGADVLHIITPDASASVGIAIYAIN
jgi:hypothetical protein